jgi:hypothetical protein
LKPGFLTILNFAITWILNKILRILIYELLTEYHLSETEPCKTNEFMPNT